ncbi:hypothetical protein HG531_006804 [Fusarium graminearum]|nr:hypothetical protein HG531_006804 [Fusarium graminearum]
MITLLQPTVHLGPHGTHTPVKTLGALPTSFHLVQVYALQSGRVLNNTVSVGQNGIRPKSEALQETAAAKLGNLDHLINGSLVPRLPVVETHWKTTRLVEATHISAHIQLVESFDNCKLGLGLAVDALLEKTVTLRDMLIFETLLKVRVQLTQQSRGQENSGSSKSHIAMMLDCIVIL